jgi:hypothetical protein
MIADAVRDKFFDYASVGLYHKTTIGNYLDCLAAMRGQRGTMPRGE